MKPNSHPIQREKQMKYRRSPHFRTKCRRKYGLLRCWKKYPVKTLIGVERVRSMLLYDGDIRDIANRNELSGDQSIKKIRVSFMRLSFSK